MVTEIQNETKKDIRKQMEKEGIKVGDCLEIRLEHDADLDITEVIPTYIKTIDYYNNSSERVFTGYACQLCLESITLIQGWDRQKHRSPDPLCIGSVVFYFDAIKSYSIRRDWFPNNLRLFQIKGVYLLSWNSAKRGQLFDIVTTV